MVIGAVPNPKFVAYERVSTTWQGRSGLGLEAQRKAIDDFAASRDATVIARFTEVESGKRNERPELDQALTLSRLTGATLVIPKLDRLSRNAAFLLTLRDGGVRFLAVGIPVANDLTVGILALVAQQEREAITRCTNEVLAAAKAQGVKLATRTAPQPSGGQGRAVWRSGRRCSVLRMSLRRGWRRWLRRSGRSGMCRYERLLWSLLHEGSSPGGVHGGRCRM